MGISIQELTNAIQTLKESLDLYDQSSENSVESKAFRDACIQRFEYGVELSWKVSMKVLGSNIAAAKPAIREMARNGLIDDPKVWLELIEARNNTSHSYDDKVASQVFKACQKLPKLASQLIQEIEKI